MMIGCSGYSRAAPLGRAWTPTEVFRIPGHTYTEPDAIGLDSLGAPLITAAGLGGIGSDLYGLRWANSTWSTSWQLGHGVNFAWPILGPADRHSLVWQTLEPMGPNANMRYLVTAGSSENSISLPETVATVFATPFFYAGAERGDRRWVAKASAGDLRLWTSNIQGKWSELDMPGVGSDGLAMGAIDDTTVLVVFQWTRERTRWGYMRGKSWEEGFPVLSSNSLAMDVHMRQSPDGGFWLAWADDSPELITMRYDSGSWGPPDTIRCAYNLSDQYFSVSARLSRDPYFEYPAVAWTAFSSNTGTETICACIPTDSGLGMADNLEDSEGGGLPVIVRDRNGDAWVAWWKYFDGMFFTHSFTIATSNAPTITGAGSNRTVSWTLSEIAPETWWAILAARNVGAFEEVARVRAGDTLDLEWIDTSAPSDSIRYKIRRECVDNRYQWLSAETVWYDVPVAVKFSLARSNAEPDHVRLEWYGPGASNLDAAVERRTELDDWRVTGVAASETADRLSYDDRTVEPAGRYAYRLSFTDKGEMSYSAETWIDVPAALSLSLEGFVPNPSIREATIAFTLPSSGKAILEVVDVAGRRVFRRDVGSLGPGRHVMKLDGSDRFRPGVYLINLSRDGRVVHARGVITK
jgi:hypothetical protein